MCVAFQNSMAATINGLTLHGGADLPGVAEDNQQHTASDIDNLFIKSRICVGS